MVAFLSCDPRACLATGAMGKPQTFKRVPIVEHANQPSPSLPPPILFSPFYFNNTSSLDCLSNASHFSPLYAIPLAGLQVSYRAAANPLPLFTNQQLFRCALLKAFSENGSKDARLVRPFAGTDFTFTFFDADTAQRFASTVMKFVPAANADTVKTRLKHPTIMSRRASTAFAVEVAARKEKSQPERSRGDLGESMDLGIGQFPTQPLK